MNLTLTPFEKKIVFFIFLMIILGDFYSFIRGKLHEDTREEEVMLYDEDEITIININTAPLESLILLPGIGKKTAERIIELRETHRFSKPEDLLEVKGIGYKKLERIKRYLSFK